MSVLNNGLRSSLTDEWATPIKVFDALNAEFNFNLDPCANETNHKTPVYYDAKTDGLSKPWVGSVFVNPPYGRKIGQWVEKAY